MKGEHPRRPELRVDLPPLGTDNTAVGAPGQFSPAEATAAWQGLPAGPSQANEASHAGIGVVGEEQVLLERVAATLKEEEDEAPLVPPRGGCHPGGDPDCFLFVVPEVAV